MTHLYRARARSLLSVLSGIAFFCGCSGSDDSGSNGSVGAAGSAVIFAQGGSSVGGSGNGSGSGNGDGSTSSQGCADTSTDVCAGTNFEVESIPLDIYILFDQSGSMSTKVDDAGTGVTRMAAVVGAVSTFLRDPNSAGIGVGIGYFGVQPIGEVSCDPAGYSQADVSVGLDHETVIKSLAKRAPTGETPTAAALNGACAYAEGYRESNPTHAVAILLVTDGKPEAPVSCSTGGCCPTLDQATKEAKSCLTGKQRIPTYVLGVGPNLDNLHAIAQAGGTKSAYLVGDQNVTSNVLAALSSIRRAAQIPCQFEIPMARTGVVDLERVNVVYAQGSCDFKTIYYVKQPETCADDGGWYFDNPASPAFIKLCSQSCDSVSATGTALKVSVGCARQEPPIR